MKKDIITPRPPRYDDVFYEGLEWLAEEEEARYNTIAQKDYEREI